MSCECSKAKADTAGERKILRIALLLNGLMFVVGSVAGWWAESSGLIADALDMLADASAYGIALLATRRSQSFKRRAALLSGSLLLILGLGIAVDVARKGVYGSEPKGEIMMAFSFLSLIVNLSVLRMLKPFREGELHLRATWIFTKVDVIANLVVFTSGAIVWTTNQRMVDLVVGGLIALYVIRESIQILSQAIAVKPCAP